MSTAAGIGAIALAPELGKALGVLAIDLVALSAAAAGGLLAIFGAAIAYTAINSPLTGIDPRIKPAPTPDVGVRATEQPYHSKETILAPTMAPDWLKPIPVATPAPYYDYTQIQEREKEKDTPIPPEMKRRWQCNTKCQIAGSNTWCSGYMSGIGIGNSQPEACAAAKAAINAEVREGCYKRHCGCDAPGNKDCRMI